MIILSVVFTTQQIITLNGRKGTIFTQSTFQNFYDDSDSFGADDGLLFAIAVADFLNWDLSDRYGRDLSEYIEIEANL